MILKRLGKQPKGNRLKRIKEQENYENGKFHNLEPTEVNPFDVSMVKILKEFLTRPSSVKPSRDIPNKKTDLINLYSNTPAVVWFGHSSYLLHYKGFNMLVDPVFSGHASPVSFYGKSFKGTDNYSVENFPTIDLLLLTHDHYDHLDYQFLKKIRSKVKKVVASLGVGAHLEYWKYDKNIITELGWDETTNVNSTLEIRALPSRHFSGRSVKRFNTLWSSFALEWDGYKIFIGGDSGYTKSFREIGKKYGGFDLAFLECGQYSRYWPQIHMTPQETVKAAGDLGAAILFPVHWGKFVLSIHPWNEPIKNLIPWAKKHKQTVVAPYIGETYIVGETYAQTTWWNFD